VMVTLSRQGLSSWLWLGFTVWGLPLSLPPTGHFWGKQKERVSKLAKLTFESPAGFGVQCESARASTLEGFKVRVRGVGDRRFWVSGCRVQGLWLRVRGLRVSGEYFCDVWGFGFWVWGSRFRV